MKSRSSLLLFVIIIFSLLQGCSENSKNLTRSSSKEILLKNGFDYITFKINAICKSDNGKLLIKNNYAIIPRGYENMYIKPLPKLMPFYIELKSEGLWYKSAILIYGKITEVETTGISVVDENNKKVEFNLTVEPNEIGKLIGGPRIIPIVVSFQLFDDGWRYKEISWKDTNAKNDWNKNKLYGFYDEETYLNTVLWKMHENNNYSHNFKTLASRLEEIGDYNALDTVAWVYKDNGERDKAIRLYEKKIMPAVRESGDVNELKKFQEYLAKISS